MKFAKRKSQGRAERRDALARVFEVDRLIAEGRRERLPVEDVLDAMVSCWSAMRLAEGRGRSLVTNEATIWV
jgi:predicted RNase H-like nuclease